MTDILLDTTILIDLSIGRPEAVTFVSGLSPSRLLSHPASEAEFLVGAKNRRELRNLIQLLDRLRRVRPIESDFDQCISSVRRLTLAHGIGLPDCLIAATCQRVGCAIATANDRHFRLFRGLEVVRPY